MRVQLRRLAGTFAAALVLAVGLAGSPGSAHRVAADGGLQNHPADVFVMFWHYVPDTVHIHQGQSFTFGNYDPEYGIPAHSLDEVVPECTSPPFTGNDPGHHGCRSPRFSSGLVDHTYVHRVDGADRLPRGTYEFTCQVHPFMRGTLVVD
jgi:plastocyanin